MRVLIQPLRDPIGPIPFNDVTGPFDRGPAAVYQRDLNSSQHSYHMSCLYNYAATQLLRGQRVVCPLSKDNLEYDLTWYWNFSLPNDDDAVSSRQLDKEYDARAAGEFAEYAQLAFDTWDKRLRYQGLKILLGEFVMTNLKYGDGNFARHELDKNSIVFPKPGPFLKWAMLGVLFHMTVTAVPNA